MLKMQIFRLVHSDNLHTILVGGGVPITKKEMYIDFMKKLSSG